MVALVGNVQLRHCFRIGIFPRLEFTLVTIGNNQRRGGLIALLFKLLLKVLQTHRSFSTVTRFTRRHNVGDIVNASFRNRHNMFNLKTFRMFTAVITLVILVFFYFLPLSSRETISPSLGKSSNSFVSIHQIDHFSSWAPVIFEDSRFSSFKVTVVPFHVIFIYFVAIVLVPVFLVANLTQPMSNLFIQLTAISTLSFRKTFCIFGHMTREAKSRLDIFMFSTLRTISLWSSARIADVTGSSSFGFQLPTNFTNYFHDILLNKTRPAVRLLSGQPADRNLSNYNVFSCPDATIIPF